MPAQIARAALKPVWERDPTASDWHNRPFWLLACEASQGSLDAAKALHEAVLPGRGWFFEAGGTPRMCAGIFHEDVKTPPHIGKADTPSRAWLVAIIKALIAMEKTDDQ